MSNNSMLCVNSVYVRLNSFRLKTKPNPSKMSISSLLGHHLRLLLPCEISNISEMSTILTKFARCQ